MATEVSTPSLGQLQSVQKVMALPTVGAAVGQVGALYSRVKGAHSLLDWALSTAEASVTLAANTAAPFVAAPLAAGDARVAAALDQLEKRVPIVTEQPKVIVETTKQAVLSRITPQLNKVYGARDAAEQRVKSLKELTWVKANALLSTAYGQKAVQGVDSGAVYAMRLLDHYLPPAVDETPAGTEVVAFENDPTLHTVQTVRRLGAVAARRVWANLAARVTQLRANGEWDILKDLPNLKPCFMLKWKSGFRHRTCLCQNLTVLFLLEHFHVLAKFTLLLMYHYRLVAYMVMTKLVFYTVKLIVLQRCHKC
ncbi:lipid storage droplets surface-binding protein 2 isoform X2 [Colias croceus]|uniref:lipid storage droplets surface-binding protein 2 isoform X2 n=1 Tax=Colias crocea TaxID=72248 RepID=UPI001E27C6F6|nr:lipid storage droplets surface-binding protein 2 isoform X2 [Colias croceus]